MNTYTHISKSLFLTAILCFGIIQSVPVYADDTEVYTGANSISTTPPNVVFILDSSGSMKSNKISLANKGDYDPDKIYEGYCKKDRIYWNPKSDTDVPNCLNYTSSSGNDADRYIEKAHFKCNAAASDLAGSTGTYTDTFARYVGGTWVELLDDEVYTYDVECSADAGIHGIDSTSTDTYAADAADGGPWRADSTGAVKWSKTGSEISFWDTNYINWYYQDRYTTVMMVMRDLLTNMVANEQFINLAIMRFNYKSGGYFIKPMTKLSATNKDGILSAIYDVIPNDYTPLSETLYEAYLYYNGKTPDWGQGINVAGVVDATTGKYISPVEYKCQKNYVVLLTDGTPSEDTNSDSDIEGLPGFSATNNNSNSCSGNCLDEMAGYMYQTDCSTGTGGLDDTQNVITHAVGFATDQTLLNNTASKGHGNYEVAYNPQELATALTKIFNEIRAVNSTFTAPAVSVNAYKRSYHNDELYFALFIPDKDGNPLWSGNIKRYQSKSDGIYDNSATQKLAVDPTTGFTYADTRSWWTADADAPDGDVVAKGGAASKLDTPANRNVYTFVGTLSGETTLSTGHDLATTNSSITETVLGDATITNKNDLINWARGQDLKDIDADSNTTEARRQMADPLHAQPLLIPYAATSSSQDITLYAATNEGYLHAIDPDDGTELWAFMPQELLPNIKKLYDNDGNTPHPYGLDGPLTYWHYDKDGDGVPYTNGTLDTDEFVYLYQGMRRGGNSYYSLNVTDRATPKLRWQIKGGTTGFTEIGETWSAMKKAKVKIGTTVKDVVIFGGGYDTNQDSTVPLDSSSNHIADSIGRAIYMVDAASGSVVWSGGPASSGFTKQFSDMTYSIPSDVTVLNINNDSEGLADLIYVGDMGGRIWRFDVNNGASTAADLVTGGIIANLGDNTVTDNARRFYYAPEVVLSNDRKYLYIAIGSGYRAHPLNKTIHDAFYVIRDPYVYSAPTAYTYVDNGASADTEITMSDLYDATAHTIGNTTTASNDLSTARTSLANAHGWYIWLNDASNAWVGEKLTASATAIGGTVFFTTFSPVISSSSTTNCAPGQGTTLLYHVNLNDGSAVEDYQGTDSTYTREDRVVDEIKGGGLPPKPALIFHEDGSITISVGLVQLETNFSMVPQKYKWEVE